MTNETSIATDVFILTDCYANACVAAATSSATYANAPPGTYYIMVDGFAAASGGYTLTVTGGCGLDCTNPVQLACGVPYNGDTTGGASNVSQYSCTTWIESGPEVVHVITTTQTSDLTATLTNEAFDIDVFILDACDANACVAYDMSSATYANAPPGTYYIVVDGYQGAEGSYTLTVTGCECPLPATPASISYPSGDCDGSFTVSWSAVSGATSYKLQRADNLLFAWPTTVYTGSSTSWNQTGLADGTYYYRVLAKNSCGSSYWRTGGAIVVGSAPGIPGSISYPGSDCDGSFIVSWSPVSGVGKYILERATNPSFSGAIMVYSGLSTSYSEAGLADGTYYYRVLAKNSCGSSGWRTGGAIVVGSAPGIPASITYPSSDCDGSFTVSWSAVSGATKYGLQRATNSSFTDATTVYTGASTSYSETGLAPGTYYYRAGASNSCSFGGWRTGGAIVVDSTDTDGDGIADCADNCTLVPNPDQCDTNGDGYGNMCDPDLNNDCYVTSADLPFFSTAFFSCQGDPNFNPDADLNCDGCITSADLPILSAHFFGSPGPGQGPCE